jgi:hypothetical protein
MRVYRPQLQEAQSGLTSSAMAMYATEIAKVMAGDLSRFDGLKDGDLPKVTRVDVEFSSRHVRRTPRMNHDRDHRADSDEHVRNVAAKALLADIRFGGGHIDLPVPIAIPYKWHSNSSYRSAFKMASKQERVPTIASDASYKAKVVFTVGGNDGQTTTNRVANKLWKQFEQCHAIAADAMDFYDLLMAQLEPIRTLKRIKDEWPDIYADFVSINDMVVVGKGVGKVIDPNTVDHVNKIIAAQKRRETKAVKAAQQEKAHA